MRSDPGHARYVRRAAKNRSALQGSAARERRRRAGAKELGEIVKALKASGEAGKP